MRQVFEAIYAQDAWQGQGSGEGSQPVHNRGYMAFLQDFLARHRIRSVVDLGCGDWQFSRLLDWTGIDYRGYDLVASVVDRNRRDFARPNLSFHLYDGDFSALPAADLLLAKDVLQHWSAATIHSFRPHLARFGKALITNCVNPAGPTTNEDIPDGAFRYLDLRLAPFSWPAGEVFRYSNHRPFWQKPFLAPRWTKVVLQSDPGGL